VEFEWDETKQQENLRKHGVAFEEAITVFDEPEDYVEFYDEAHSTIEERFITIGPIRGGLVLVVWTERDIDTVRVISARWATSPERSLYRNRMETRR
jgi:uncharacterized DUF497 family protein